MKLGLTPRRDDPAKGDPAKGLEQLTEPERRLIHQLFWDGHSVGELARVSGVSQERLRTRKSRALHKLLVYLEECV